MSNTRIAVETILAVVHQNETLQRSYQCIVNCIMIEGLSFLTIAGWFGILISSKARIMGIEEGLSV